MAKAAVEAVVPWRLRDAALLMAVAFGVLALSAVGMLGLYQLQGAPRAAPPQPPLALAVLATDLYYLSILAGVWLLVVRRYGVRWSTLGLRLPRRSGLPMALVLCVLLAAGTVALVMALAWALGQAGAPVQFALIDGLPARTDPLFVAVVAGSLLLTPVAEELLFRGVLYQSLRRRGGVILATTASATIFALLHFQPVMLPELLLLGIVLAVSFEQTHSLYPSILMHMAYNGAIIIAALHA